MTSATPALLPVPVVDVRDGGPARHAVDGRARALSLRDECLSFFPRRVQRMLPVLDAAARRWLRRSRHPWLRPYALALNAMQPWRLRFIPPDHLLRRVFETCQDFAEARHRLETTPVARPVIYTLIGCQGGERCVIERSETAATTHSDDTSAANDWLRSTPNWEARMRADLMFTRSAEEAAANS